MLQFSNLFKIIFLYPKLWIYLSKKTSRKFDSIDALFGVIILGIYTFLIFMIEETSISEREAKNFFENPDFLYVFARWICSIFGQNDLALKSPMLALHFINLSLLYGICRRIFRKKQDSLYVILIYGLLPGANFSALIFSQSAWIASFSLFVGYIYTRYKKFPLVLIALVSMLDSGAFVLLLGAGGFFIIRKDLKTALTCLICLGINLYLYGLDIGGRPQAYFLETLGQIAMLYSPILFIYYIYSIYWGLRKGSFLSYIAASSILCCFLLSFRQNIDFYTLIPQSLIGLPVMAQCFLNDLRMHLKPFRKPYYFFASCALLALVLQSSITFGNKLTYIFSSRPNFASSYYFSKEIANALKSRGITAISAPANLQYQLRFYGIPKSPHFFLTPVKKNSKADITISYAKREIHHFKITKR